MVDIAHATAPKAPRRRTIFHSQKVQVPITRLSILILLICVWQFGVTDDQLPYFSRPTLVLGKLAELLGQGAIYRHIWVTLQEILIGYFLGALLGLTLGFLLGRSQFLSLVFQPFIIGLYSIPKIALAPVFIVWLGLGMASKVAVVFLASFFLVFFNTYSGLRMVNEELGTAHGCIMASNHFTSHLTSCCRSNISRFENCCTVRGDRRCHR